MTKRHAIAFSFVALLLSPVLLAVGALVVIPLLIIAIAALPLVGIAVLTGMITLAERAIEPSPGGPSATLMSGAPA
jgi:hypothetical protein